MSEHGYIALARGILDHHVVGARKPYSEFEAWAWLLFEATYKPRRITVTNGRTREVLELRRGQLSHSRSYTAKAWGWSEKRVRGFLLRLEKNQQIDRQTGHLQTVISICNYERYQSPETSKGRQKVPQTDRQRAGKGPEEEERNQVTQVIKDSTRAGGTENEKKQKPRHGARTKDGKRIWFDFGTMEWNAYAAEYRQTHFEDPSVQWKGTGSWFNYFPTGDHG